MTQNSSASVIRTRFWADKVCHKQHCVSREEACQPLVVEGDPALRGAEVGETHCRGRLELCGPGAIFTEFGQMPPSECHRLIDEDKCYGAGR
jgi:hypothetical protein